MGLYPSFLMPTKPSTLLYNKWCGALLLIGTQQGLALFRGNHGNNYSFHVFLPLLSLPYVRVAKVSSFKR